MKSKMHAGALHELYKRAKELRDHATQAEEVLWGYLKTKPHGYKFRRQHPYSVYILDFYCHKLKLVIEVDGSVHNLKEVQHADQERQHLLEQDGMVVLRFTNNNILSHPEDVFAHIEQFIKQRNEHEGK